MKVTQPEYARALILDDNSELSSYIVTTESRQYELPEANGWYTISAIGTDVYLLGGADPTATADAGGFSMMVPTGGLLGPVRLKGPVVAFIAASGTAGVVSFTKYTGAIAQTSSTIDLSGLELTSPEVDNYLIRKAADGLSGATIDISGTNSARTSKSNSAVTTLETAGCTITANDYLLESDQEAALNTTTIKLTIPSGAATIHWGDGASTACTCDGVLNTYTHDHLVAGYYGVYLTGDYSLTTALHITNQAWIKGDLVNIAVLTALSSLVCTSNGSTGNLSSISGLTSLTYLDISGTSVIGSLTSLAGMTGMVFLFFQNTAISGALSNISGMTSLAYVGGYNTSISGDLADLAPLVGLVYTYLHTNSLTYTQGALPAWAANAIHIYDLGLSAQEVDDFIIDFEDGHGAAGTLNIGGTNATRTAASDVAVASLRTTGWTVTVNE